MNNSRIRKEFKALEDVVFVDVPHVVVPPRSVIKAYRSLFDECAASFGRGIMEKAWAIVEEARENIACLLGVEKEEIAFVKNTAEAMGIISSGYPFSKGEKVILSDQEHPSNLFPWINLSERKGVVLDVIHSCCDMDISEDAYISRMDSSTVAVVVSSTQFTTGVRLDLERLGGECSKRGILFIVDGIQSVGRLHLDVRKAKISWLGCGANKGLLGILGAGFVFCERGLIPRVIPPYVGYQSVNNPVPPPALTEDFESIHWKTDAGRFESGNLNCAGIAAINAGVKLLQILDVRKIENHVLSLERELIKKISPFDLYFRTPIAKKHHHSGILCVYYERSKEEQVREILENNKVYATFRGGYIRIGFHCFNTERDVDVLADVLRQVSEL